MVQRKKTSGNQSGLARRSSRSSGSQNGDGFYPKSPETKESRSTDEEGQKDANTSLQNESNPL
jgi:hypothetical protein